MNTILYPPLIEPHLQAFASDVNLTGILKIPFKHHSAINPSGMYAMVAKLCTLGGRPVMENNLLYGTIKYDENNMPYAEFNWGKEIIKDSVNALAQQYHFNWLMTNDTSNIGTGLIFETNNEYDEVMHRFKNELASIGTNSLNGEIRGMFQGVPLPQPSENNTVVINNSDENLDSTSTRTLRDGVNLFATELSFDINDIQHNQQVISQLTVGSFYRIQLAYVLINNYPNQTEFTGNDIGYYSDVAIIKYTQLPTVKITNLDSQKINTMLSDFNGQVIFYDPTDGLYSYEYTLTDEEGNILESSGECIYNTTDSITFSTNLSCLTTSWSYLSDLNYNSLYYITYTIKTISGLTVSSMPYALIHGYAVGLKLPPLTKLIAKAELDTSYVAVNLDAGENDTYYAGTFEVLRTDSLSNYKVWEKIFEFTLDGQKLTRNLINDYTVQQGIIYQYAIRQTNSYGIISTKLKSNLVTVDYEDMYLSDATHLLRIRFNPNISTFKPTILESKLDTIGNKYPYIFRNGIVNYKEFALTGLLSYLMDDKNTFLAFEDSIYALLDKSSRPATPGWVRGALIDLTDLTSTNIHYEKEFKLKVLNWLTNGKPKLLRSPTEGTYIVQLLNTSLSPQATLGRMLHTFTSTAYEIAEVNFKNLIKYNLIKTDYDWSSERPITHFQGYTFGNESHDMPLCKVHFFNNYTNYRVPTLAELTKEMTGDKQIKNCLNGYVTQMPQYLYHVQFDNCIPGSIFGITFERIVDNKKTLDTNCIMIGKTGHYEVQLNYPILYIYALWLPPEIDRIVEEFNTATQTMQHKTYYKQTPYFKGSISFAYEDYLIDRTFELIRSVQLTENIIQISGIGTPVNSDTGLTPYFTEEEAAQDIFKLYGVNNLACNVSHIQQLTFKSREIETCYLITNDKQESYLCRTAYVNQQNKMEGKIPLLWSELRPNAIYKCYTYHDGHVKQDENDVDELPTIQSIHYLDGRLLLYVLSEIHQYDSSEWTIDEYWNLTDDTPDLATLEKSQFVYFPYTNIIQGSKPWIDLCTIYETGQDYPELETIDWTGSVNDKVKKLFTVAITEAGNKDTFFVMPTAPQIQSALTLENSNAPNYEPENAEHPYIPQNRLAAYYKYEQITQHEGRLTTPDRDIPNLLTIQVGAMIQVEGVITLARIDYDIDKIKDEELFTIRYEQMETLAQEVINTPYNFQLFTQYRLYRAIENYVWLLSYYILMLGVFAQQPLMVPPPDWEGFAEFNFPTTIDDDEINNILPWWYTNIYTPIDDRALIEQSIPNLYYYNTNNERQFIFNLPEGRVGYLLTQKELNTLAATSEKNKIKFDYYTKQKSKLPKKTLSEGGIEEEEKMDKKYQLIQITEATLSKNIDSTDELKSVLKQNHINLLPAYSVLTVLKPHAQKQLILQGKLSTTSGDNGGE